MVHYGLSYLEKKSRTRSFICIQLYDPCRQGGPAFPLSSSSILNISYNYCFSNSCEANVSFDRQPMHALAVGLFFTCMTTVALFDDAEDDFTFFGH